MSDDHQLPPGVADAVDHWLDEGGDDALDRLQTAVADVQELDGDLAARGAGLVRELGGEASGQRSRRPGWAALASAALVAALVTALIWPPTTATLVTAEEAAAPLDSPATRGAATPDLSGPTLHLQAPLGEPGEDPFRLVLVARPNGAGVPIDKGSLRVTYRRGPGVDLVPRMHGRWEGDEYIAEGLSLPQGEHPIEFTISDEELEWTTLRVLWTVP